MKGLRIFFHFVSPGVDMDILLTVLNVFLMVLVWRICLKSRQGKSMFHEASVDTVKKNYMVVTIGA